MISSKIGQLVRFSMFFSENSRLQAETHLDPGVSVKAAQNAMNLAAAKSSDRSDRAPKLPPAQ
jgi:hypothetical protein